MDSIVGLGLNPYFKMYMELHFWVYVAARYLQNKASLSIRRQSSYGKAGKEHMNQTLTKPGWWGLRDVTYTPGKTLFLIKSITLISH